MKLSLPKRRLIPRWRPISQTLETHEVESLQAQPTRNIVFDHELFNETVEAWREHPTAGHLGDVISFSADDELQPRIAQVVGEAIQKGHAVTETQKSIFADWRAEWEDLHDANTSLLKGIQPRVAQLRKELLVAPDNLLALLDMSQLQLASGKHDAAQRYLFTALNLAPNGRIVLRTAARFFVHMGDYERAHSLIARHPATKEDPWLLASEISLADTAGRSSVLVNVARRMIRSSKRSARQLAELAGALATLDLREGSYKDARSHLRLALEQPTDNVIAQAFNDARLLGISLDDPSVCKAVSRSAEAQLLRSWQSLDEESSETHALTWHAEEPFSSRPFLFLTTLYSLQGDHEKALKWVQTGLIADPLDPGLASNQCFTLAATGDLAGAEASLKRARALRNPPPEPYLQATEGLIALQRRQFDHADILYRDSEQTFIRQGQDDVAALCIAHYAKFAKQVDAPNAAALLLEAETLVKKAPTVDSVIMLDRLGRHAISLPAEENLRKLNQWLFDPVSNKLIQKQGVTAKGASGLVIVDPAKWDPISGTRR